MPRSRVQFRKMMVGGRVMNIPHIDGVRVECKMIGHKRCHVMGGGLFGDIGQQLQSFAKPVVQAAKSIPNQIKNYSRDQLLGLLQQVGAKIR
jgi:hypothetical protein